MRNGDNIRPPKENGVPGEGNEGSAGATGSGDTKGSRCAYGSKESEEHRTANSGGSHCGLFELFITGFGGYDPRLVARYADADAEHERKKLFKIGLSVFIPAFLALFTAYFFLAPYVQVTPTRIVYSVMAALFILLVDSVVVATIGQHAGFGTLIRLMISLCMGWILAEPVLLQLYQPSVGAQIVRDLKAERAQNQASHETDLANAAQEYRRLDEQLQGDRSQLEQLTPAALMAQHLKERETKKGQLLDQARSQAQHDVAGLYSERTELEGQRERIQKEIEAKTIDMQNESAGRRASGRKGIGVSGRAWRKHGTPSGQIWTR